MNIIIFGPPLAGKGTQCEKILEKFNLTHLSTGDALRREKELGTDLGNEAAEYSNKGLLAPDELVARVVEKFYNDHKSDSGILFDGYPRNIDQAKHLQEVFSKNGDALNQIIHLQVPREELLVRAEIRAAEQNRKDDKDPEIVLRRIDEYERSTIPAIDMLRTDNVELLEIDGNQDIEKIHTEIKGFLK